VTVNRPAAAITYPEGQTLSVKFQGTYRLPLGRAEAKVERKKGMTEIEIELDDMKPATLFGGQYNTYVLWALSPEGVVKNAGEFIIQGTKSKLDVSTQLDAFAMFITAEPHYLVQVPSRVVVLENVVPEGTRGTRALPYTTRAAPACTRSSTSPLPTSSRKPRARCATELGQAKAAVSLAEEAKAAQYAPEKLAEAKAALAKLEQTAGAGAAKTEVTELGREAVRLAVATRDAALKAYLLESKRQADETKARLQKGLARVAEVRDTARGLVINLPMWLFDSGRQRSSQRRARSSAGSVAS